VTDFGFAINKQFLEADDRYPCLGTPTHFAFEMLVPTSDVLEARGSKTVKKCKYDERVDIWCLGIILYSLLYRGETPFDVENPFDKEDTKQRIRDLNYTFPHPRYPEGEDLIKRILVPPQTRLSLAQILQHPFCKLM
jgi:serine/threonine protein kinase